VILGTFYRSPGHAPSSTAHLASSPPVESDETQLGTEMESPEHTESVRGPSPQVQEEGSASYTTTY